MADRLLSWKAGLLSRPGRTTLIKSMLSAIPVHIRAPSRTNSPDSSHSVPTLDSDVGLTNAPPSLLDSPSHTPQISHPYQMTLTYNTFAPLS